MSTSIAQNSTAWHVHHLHVVRMQLTLAQHMREGVQLLRNMHEIRVPLLCMRHLVFCHATKTYCAKRYDLLITCL